MSYKQPTRAWKLNATEYNETQRLNRSPKHSDAYRDKSNNKILLVVFVLIVLFAIA